MYLAHRPRPIDSYKDLSSEELVMDITPHVDLQQQQMILADSGGEDHELRAPKKRAETWVQDETRSLIAFRREVDALFNTSKSNKHLWEQISSKMREKGFDRSPTMCTDKWRNLLKEFKKLKQQDRGNNNCNNSGSASSANKMWYYKELEELLRDRAKNGSYKSPPPPPPPPPPSAKVEAYIHF
ncbi:unnamed protein product, partial [Coffea canephora]